MNLESLCKYYFKGIMINNNENHEYGSLHKVLINDDYNNHLMIIVVIIYHMKCSRRCCLFRCIATCTQHAPPKKLPYSRKLNFHCFCGFVDICEIKIHKNLNTVQNGFWNVLICKN